MMNLSFKLNNGVKIPAVGLGTYKSMGEELENAVVIGLQNWIRHIDTATGYKNENNIRKAIEKSGINREDIFLTSKISPYQQGTEAAEKACKDSLENLGVEALDLMLIHWPGAANIDVSSFQNAKLRLETWRVMEKYYKNGKFRSIGVSNYEVRHLDELIKVAEIHPMVNQIEIHPRLPQLELYIQVIAYSSLGTGKLLSQEIVKNVAFKYNKTPAQILLKWALQRNLIVIPKSVHEKYIKEFCPFMLFNGWEVSDEDLQQLARLNDGFKYCWDPTKVV